MKYCREKGLDSAFEIWFVRVWSPSRLYNTVSQFIRGLVPMKLPVFRTRVLTRCERDRIFFNFITNLTQIVIIFDAHTRVFTIFKRVIRAVHPIPYRSGRTEEIAWWGFIHLTKIWVCYTTMSVKCYGRINLTSIWITISIGVTIVKLQSITQVESVESWVKVESVDSWQYFLQECANLFSQKLRVLRVWTNIDKVYLRVPYLETESIGGWRE